MSEDILQTSVGPPTLNHVIGQKVVVEQARIALDASFEDGTCYPATLMTGGPGLGKSMISRTIAREFASGYTEVLGQALCIPADMNALLLSAAEKSIVFIDEADELPLELQTTLYKAIEERRIYLESSSPGKPPQPVPLVPFTVILASNHEHSIVKPLRDRMKLILRFEPYSEAELTEILRQRARSLGWTTEESVFAQIAQRGRGTPRIALRFLESCRRVCRSNGEKLVRSSHLDKACSLEGIDATGLDRQEMRLLRILCEAKRPVRLNVLASHIGLPGKTIAEVFEPYLLRLNLIQRAAEGRLITAQGMDYLRNHEPTNCTEGR